MSNICAISFYDDDFKRSDIVKILQSNLGHLEPKPVLYYALNFLKNTEGSTDQFAIQARRKMYMAIKEYSTFPYDESVFDKEMHRVFAWISKQDELAEFVIPVVETKADRLKQRYISETKREIRLHHSLPIISVSQTSIALNIRNNPVYKLKIPALDKEKSLGENATSKQVNEQILTFELACKHLIEHLNLILGRSQTKRSSPDEYDARKNYAPLIQNIDEIAVKIKYWALNLQDASPSKRSQIEKLYNEICVVIDNYKEKLHVSPTQENDDYIFLAKLYASINSALVKLTDVVSKAHYDQEIKGLDKVIDQLEEQMKFYIERCPPDVNTYKRFQEKLRDKMEALQSQDDSSMTDTESETGSPPPSRLD